MTDVQTRPAITGIDIVAYSTTDGERGKAFYRDTLGLKLTTDYGPQGGEFELADGSTFGIWQVAADEFKPSSGVMFAVADVAAATAYFKEQGVAFDMGPEEMPSCSMAMARDPDGNAFILHHRK